MIINGELVMEWKKLYSEKYAVLLEGARRVGKSTIAETFAKNEYRSYIMIDFSKTTSNILECFDDIGNLNIFFLRLQAETGITLYEHDSLIIFDEVQLFPKARQAIKHLISQKDAGKKENLLLKSFYLLPFLVK